MYRRSQSLLPRAHSLRLELCPGAALPCFSVTCPSSKLRRIISSRAALVMGWAEKGDPTHVHEEGCPWCCCSGSRNVCQAAVAPVSLAGWLEVKGHGACSLGADGGLNAPYDPLGAERDELSIQCRRPGLCSDCCLSVSLPPPAPCCSKSLLCRHPLLSEP